MFMLHWILSKNKLKQKSAIKVGIIFLALFCFIFLLSNDFVLAQGIETVEEGVEIIEEPIGLPTTDIRLIVANVIRVALGLVGFVLLVILIYAGFLWMTAGGNEDQVGKAKAMLKNAVIGLAIILSAYSIVFFVMRLLGIETGGFFGEERPTAPVVTNLTGSGALGKEIKDHYPMRNQIDVARNTKIIITFSNPVKPDSFIVDKNDDGVFGNICTGNMEQNCDYLKPLSVDTEPGEDNKLANDSFISVYHVNAEGIKEAIRGASVIATETTVNNVTGVYTIVISPYDVLGSAQDKFTYEVNVGNGILFDDSANNNPSLFNSSLDKKYTWEFTCSTELDDKPPHVVGVFPAGNTTDNPKNTVIQIHFSEPVSPEGLQGFVAERVDYLTPENGNVLLKTERGLLAEGSFNLLNGYTTLEFTPSKECGYNSCGNPIYCLPVCSPGDGDCEDDETSTENYSVLLRAAQITGNADFPFEAVFGTGVVDLAGNALDGNNDGEVNNSWFDLNSMDSFDDLDTGADNYYFSFDLRNYKEDKPLVLKEISPAINQGFVSANEELSMTFSKPLRMETLYDGIKIEEYPENGTPICEAPRLFTSLGLNVVKESHCPFLEDKSQFYYPVLTSEIQDVYFNCFYPGQGPALGGVDGMFSEVADTCNVETGEGCTDSELGSPNDLSCNGIPAGQISALGSNPTTEDCVNYLKNNSLVIETVE